MEEKKAQYRTYTEEFKLEALALVKSSGKKCGQIERELGITPGLLVKWRNKYQVLAYAAMDTGKDVTWIPSYGPEMRGGTANCTVVIADHEIGSPLVKNPPLAVALNLPSFDKYEEVLAPGGTLIVNQSMIDRDAKRTDINVIFVPCDEIAEELGDKKLMNMVAMGALLTALPEVTVKDIEKALEAHLPKRHAHLLPKNYEALRRGFEAAQKVPA